MSFKKGIYIVIILLTITIFLKQMDSLVENEDVVVFIIDDRINPEVLDNKPVIYDNHISHGSIVARLIKKEAPAVNIYPLEVSNIGGSTSWNLYISALKEILSYIENNPEKKIIVNISLAFYDNDDEHHSLIKRLTESGVLIISAAGNNNSNIPIYPAGFGETVAVASADREGKELYSNYGEYIDIAAPGRMEESFYLYFAGGLRYNHIRTSGTSLAAPRVSGLLAKILTLDSELSVSEAYSRLISHSVEINDDLYKDGLLGTGVINKWGTLVNIDSFFFLKESTYLLALVFLVIFIILWFKHGVVSIFFTILITLMVMPALLVLEEFIYTVRKNGLQVSTLIFIFIILIVLFIPLFLKWKRRHELQFYLDSSYDLDVDKVLRQADNNDDLFRIIKEYYKNNSRAVDQLVGYLGVLDLSRKSIIKEILFEENYEKIISKVFNLLRNEFVHIDINHKLFLLEIIEEKTENWPVHNEITRNKIEEYTRCIVSNTEADMWMRFQSLRTLYYVKKDKEELIPYLKVLMSDNDELIRLESRGLLEDYFKAKSGNNFREMILNEEK
ncbi:MAG: S8 family peptidase [bacterium]